MSKIIYSIILLFLFWSCSPEKPKILEEYSKAIDKINPVWQNMGYEDPRLKVQQLDMRMNEDQPLKINTLFCYVSSITHKKLFAVPSPHLSNDLLKTVKALKYVIVAQEVSSESKDLFVFKASDGVLVAKESVYYEESEGNPWNQTFKVFNEKYGADIYLEDSSSDMSQYERPFYESQWFIQISLWSFVIALVFILRGLLKRTVKNIKSIAAEFGLNYKRNKKVNATLGGEPLYELTGLVQSKKVSVVIGVRRMGGGTNFESVLNIFVSGGDELSMPSISFESKSWISSLSGKFKNKPKIDFSELCKSIGVNEESKAVVALLNTEKKKRLLVDNLSSGKVSVSGNKISYVEYNNDFALKKNSDRVKALIKYFLLVINDYEKNVK